ncbi:double-strand break repair helicase AddA [Pseudooceanicola aestuarii]|uniref:double-strand break repair helicase AddA n=1 Tax=Pseudooceanicola aestuarii TaxID=2697319 RepID=UPI0013D23667|nr:double-strand break repair helicase AddA [Pseudooceanicola aestuarii]
MTGIPRDEATLRQITAAAPDRSTWLSANAGSGKTRVLTDRVARLLLQGVSPQNILCLTYTRAAASEMQNRLFRRLGEWAMLPEPALRDALAQLGEEETIDAARLAHARTLFARAIETPGGLKIQTIHSFCSALLRRFPLEAGVSPKFTELDDRSAANLRAEVVDEIASGETAHLLDALVVRSTETSLDRLTATIAGSRDLFRGSGDRASIAAVFDLGPDVDTAAVLAEAFEPGDAEAMTRLGEVLRQSSKSTDQKAGAPLALLPDDPRALFDTAQQLCLTTAGTVRKKFPTKGVRDDNPALIEWYDDFAQRLFVASDRMKSVRAIDRAEVLNAFARDFLDRYAQAKLLRGWLDFDDLIFKTRDLLTDPAVSAWVLYRLDGGIDHILLDEAQDTSPVQWQVIELLAREFTTGQGARDEVTRTLFVVGDTKQSIYSFQGADPAEFIRMQEEFGQRLADVGRDLQRLELEYSFRSSSAVLSLVDRVFEGRADAGFSPTQTHRAFKDRMPGRVDLWGHVEPVTEDDPGDWYDPVDRVGQDHHNVILARALATRIGEMIETGTIPAEIGHTGTYIQRRVEPGDVMILVRGRNGIFPEIIRACKEQGLPIAGADRLKVGGELAVRDLTALLSFLALPEDDLSLAVVLKSPLFNWGERGLYDLAHDRAGPRLWPELVRREAEFPATVAALRDLREQVDYLRPYDLLSRVLIRHDGRLKFLRRLGEEAEDGIDALLDQALAYERTEIPSLTGFLVWMESDETEIKREVDSAANQIRVMTVHGAKGLEAPVVILPDTYDRATRYDSAVVPADDVALWSVPSAQAPEAYQELRARHIARMEEERDRLLYVAMTRAESWLIVAAAGKLGKDGDDWYSRIEEAMKAQGAIRVDTPTGPGLRIETGDWHGTIPPDAVARPATQVTPPDWTHSTPPPAPPRPVTVSPSDLGGAKALPGEAGQEEAIALRRGAMMHLLLEHLPAAAPETRADLAARLLVRDPVADPAEAQEITRQALELLERPALRPLFDGSALGEIPVTAALDELGGARLHGVIDLLIPGDGHVLAVDFKTNAVVPGTPEAVPAGLLRQMGAYAAMLAQIYPGQRIDTAILWTATGTLMELPHDLVTAALREARLP